MKFADKLKNIRKKIGISQEELADKINVSRQAVTKWETGKGIPDIDNMIALATLFNVSLDDLLLDKKSETPESEYMFESVTEYDIDSSKNFDINLGSASSVFVTGYEGEKLYIKLSSNKIPSLKKGLKVKIDDSTDIDIKRQLDITKEELKEGLLIFIKLPNNYIKKMELSVHSKNIELQSLNCENIELDVKTGKISLKDLIGDVEINCNQDVSIHSNSLGGSLSLNQFNAMSRLFIPENFSFRAVKKGIGTKIYYERQGEKVESFSENDSENKIEFNGIKSELIISHS